VTARPSSRPPLRSRALLLTALVAGSAVLAACGGSSSDDGEAGTTTAPAASRTTTVKAERLDTGDTKEATGTVSVCGAVTQMRRLQPAIRRFDGVSVRLQASTLGFPDGGDRARQAFVLRQAAESRDCDVYLAATAAEIPALAADGGLYDLAPAVGGWVAAPGRPALAPVREGERVFGVPLRASPASGVLVLSVHGRNPGGGLELLRALADARVDD
jgi:hypothetical protein